MPYITTLPDGRKVVHCMGIKAVWSNVHQEYRFTYRMGGRNQSFGAPTMWAVCDLIDELRKRRPTSAAMDSGSAARESGRDEQSE